VTDAVTFPAAVAKVQTLADGGIRFTLDTDEGQVVAAAQLMELKRLGVVVTVTMEPQKAKRDEVREDSGSGATPSRRSAKRRT